MFLPAKFRAAFDMGGYLSEHLDGCLALWTPEEFDHQLEIRQEESSQGTESRNLMRLWAQASVQVEIDRQGRMMIPLKLREFAKLEDHVCINGAVDRVELWNPQLWEPIRQSVEERLRVGD